MNWIDKKYKDQLGNRQFDDNLRQKGKKDLEKLLATEMPVTPTGTGRGPGFYAGAAGVIVIMVSIAVGVWYWQQPDEKHTVAPPLEQQPVVNPAGDETNLNRQQEEKTSAPAFPGLLDVKETPQSSTAITEDVTIADKPVSDKVPEIADDGLPMKPTRQDGVVQEFDPQINPDEDNPTAPTAAGAPFKPDSVFGAATINEEPGAFKDSDNLLIEQFENNVAVETFNGKERENPAPILINEDKETIHSPLDTNNSGGKPDELPVGSIIKEPNDINDAEADKILIGEEAVLPDKKTAEADTLEHGQKPVAVLKEEDASSGDENTVLTAKSHLDNLAFIDFRNPSENFDISGYKTFSPKRFALSIWGGYTFVGKQITGGSELYRTIRGDQEEPVWTIPTGMSIDYFFNRNWTLTIGAGWAEYGEILNYEYQFTDSISGLDGRYNSPNDYGQVIRIDSTRIVDSIFLGHWNYNFTYVSEDSVLKNNNGQVSWRYIEIPVMVGYRFGKGRIKPWVQTGISFGIPYGTSTSRYISPSGEGLQSQEEFRLSSPSLQYNYLLQLGTDYYLGSRWSVRINVFGSYQLNPAYQFLGTEQRYYRLGGTLGISYIF